MRKLKLNTVLYTRDGTRIGNGIITGFTSVNLRNLINMEPLIIYSIKTDYGNEIHLKDVLIESYFYIGKKANKTHKHFVKKDKK